MRPSLGDEVVGKKLLGLDGHELRIADESLEVGVGELLGLDQMMEMIGRSVAHRGQIVRREEPEHFECGNTLTIRGKLPEPIGLERDGEWLDPFRSMTGEVLGRQKPAELVNMLGDTST